MRKKKTYAMKRGGGVKPRMMKKGGNVKPRMMKKGGNVKPRMMKKGGNVKPRMMSKGGAARKTMTIAHSISQVTEDFLFSAQVGSSSVKSITVFCQQIATIICK